MKRYVYPLLALKRNLDLGFFRIGGPGLANCLFVAARAYLRAKDLGCEMLRPTWERLSIGQWIRGERDKRFYYGLFKDESVWSTCRKLLLIKFNKDVAVEEGLRNYFEDILDRQDEVREWFFKSIESNAIRDVPSDLYNYIAVHVRLGDFPQSMRTSVSWYRDIVLQLSRHFGKDVLVFSDGSEAELHDLLAIPNTRRVFYGNAIADMVAISRCCMLVAGKYSTFSAWGAYLGNVPSIFQEIDYGRIVPNGLEVRIGQTTKIPDIFLERVEANLNDIRR